MSYPVTHYTTYDDIRAVLGVSVDEIPDTVIGLKVYENNLNLVLGSVSGVLPPDTEDRTLSAHYEYLDVLATPTVEQTQMLATIEMVATYIVADNLADALSMSAPKTQTDGKSSLTRFSAQDTYNSVRVNIKAMLAKYFGDINELLGIATSTAEYLKVVAPETDVVLGE